MPASLFGKKHMEVINWLQWVAVGYSLGKETGPSNPPGWIAIGFAILFLVVITVVIYQFTKNSDGGSDWD